MPQSDDITILLQQVSEGRPEAVEALLAAVYDELQVLAHRQLLRERPNHTLKTADLVHEAYLKMMGNLNDIDWESRAHFFGTAARAMRQVMINYARKRSQLKRGGPNQQKVPLETLMLRPAEFSDQLLELNEALEQLESANARYGRVVECRFFAGLSIEETAEVVGVSASTVKREWRLARAWLHQALA